MSLDYRNNVVVAAGNNGSFDPPLDAIYITANASTGEGSSLTYTVGGTSVLMPSSQLRAGSLIKIGDVSNISVSTGNTFAYIGLRVLNKSGSSNVTNDTISVSEGGD